MSVSAMGIFRFFVCLLLLLLSSVSFAVDTDNDGILSIGGFHSCALDDTGLVCWGSNQRGQTNVPSLSNPTQVSLGHSHSCALDDSGVVCWGYNVDGQTNVPSLSNPTQVFLGGDAHSCAIDDTGVVCWGDNWKGQSDVPPLSNPTQVSLGWLHTCALDDSGVVCWGRNEYGETDVPSLSNPTQVLLEGKPHSCAIDDTGLVCWGYNEYGQTDVPSLSNPTQVSLGGFHSCAIDDTGLVCWGYNEYGQTDVPSLSNPTQVSVGWYHSCALDDTGVVCWGKNNYGQTDVPSLSNPTQVSMGWHYSCALDDTGVVCWGYNENGQTDVPELSFTKAVDNCPNVDNPDQLDTDGDFIGDACDSDNDNDGLPNDYETANGLNPVDASDAQSDSDMDGLTALEEYTAGTNLNHKDTDKDTLPDGWEVDNGRDPLVADYAFSTNGRHSCTLDDNQLICWGYIGAHEPRGVFDINVEIENPHTLKTFPTGTCAINSSVMRCWGDHQLGYHVNSISSLDMTSMTNVEINDALTICYIENLEVICINGRNSYNPNIVPEASNPKGLAIGSNHGCFIDDHGVKCWGHSTYYVGWYTSQDEVLNPPALTDASYIDAKGENFCAIENKKVVCWSTDNTSKVVSELPDLSKVTGLWVGESNACARNDDEIICWGDNTYGQLELPELTDLAQLYLEENHSCALDNTGLVCWGINNNGELDIPQSSLSFDPDGDGYKNHDNPDAFPLDSSEWIDTDSDGVGNNADTDDDNDLLPDGFELNYGYDPLVANLDIDNDGITNDIDIDMDNDGLPNDQDAFAWDYREQVDSDFDGVGDNSDSDDDNDFVIDIYDLYPLDANESADSDGDGVGDNADFFPNSAEYSLDSDLDQMPDAWERKYGLNPTDASDALLDQDNDGLTALEEYEAGTIPLKILDIDANGSVDALTDGLMVLRYLFGLRGQGLISNGTASDAMRTEAADIEAYIQSLMPDF